MRKLNRNHKNATQRNKMFRFLYFIFSRRFFVCIFFFSCGTEKRIFLWRSSAKEEMYNIQAWQTLGRTILYRRYTTNKTCNCKLREHTDHQITYVKLTAKVYARFILYSLFWIKRHIFLPHMFCHPFKLRTEMTKWKSKDKTKRQHFNI